MLTGEIQSRKDIPEGDMRLHYPRFSEENFPSNLDLVKDLQEIAKEKGCTSAQLAIAWVKQQSKKDGNPVIIPIPGATTVPRVQENSKDIQLDLAELAKIAKVLDSFEVKGDRYPAAHMVHTDG